MAISRPGGEVFSLSVGSNITVVCGVGFRSALFVSMTCNKYRVSPAEDQVLTGRGVDQSLRFAIRPIQWVGRFSGCLGHLGSHREWHLYQPHRPGQRTNVSVNLWLQYVRRGLSCSKLGITEVSVVFIQRSEKFS